MIEVFRENWEFILYKQDANLVLFIVNGHSNLEEVTYNLSPLDIVLYEQKGKEFLIERARSIRQGLPGFTLIENNTIEF
jgi:hypothetical protein